MELRGRIKRVQGLSSELNKSNSLSGKLSKPGGGKSDHYIKPVSYYFNNFIKTTSKIVPIVYEESEETE